MTDLDTAHGLPGRVRFRQNAGGVPLADITTEQATACISLNGGQILSWQPRSEAQAVIWLSPRAKLKAGQSIRGGSPVCWPWFGPHPRHADFPQHGYARNSPWAVEAVEALSDGAIRMALRLQQTAAHKPEWLVPATLTTEIIVGAALSLTLTTHNQGTAPLFFSEALHTYLGVSDVAAVRVRGLEGCTYVDKVKKNERSIQHGALTFTAETDRVYLDTTADCVLEDTGLGRRIRVVKSGSQSTVIWNPWQEKAGRMDDIGEDNWRKLLCIESANALDNSLTLAPGATHHLAVTYSVEH